MGRAAVRPMWHVAVFLILLVASVGYAFWRGGPPERIGAAVLLGGTLASFFAVSGAHARWLNLETGLLIVDAAMLAAILILLVRANRLWPIPMAALLIVQVAGHFLKTLDPHIYPFLYWLTSSLWSYLVTAILIVATHNHRRRLKKFGQDISWNASSRRSSANDRAISREP
ncbi:MAG: hypothetical protein IIZ38_18405 [Sphingomonas sp.]|uniref:hypothetical protein n=1 Tax=unclassified Sphingomonas TaxID=196159 RepID=UPI002458B0C2|nr:MULTISPECIES: hypothetical protein [unclassified Sphingomonas]MBQ1500284.1 hypothetical protein [Sphingomonas sp.]MDH4744148.1 hypothetical protein [Sphingomonas sp. CBMAI 2297]